MSGGQRLWRLQADWIEHGQPKATRAEVLGPCSHATARKHADSMLTTLGRLNPQGTGFVVHVAPGDLNGSLPWVRDPKAPAFRRTSEDLTGPSSTGTVDACPPDLYRQRMSELRAVSTGVDAMAPCSDGEAKALVASLLDRFGEQPPASIREAVAWLRTAKYEFASAAVGRVIVKAGKK